MNKQNPSFHKPEIPAETTEIKVRTSEEIKQAMDKIQAIAKATGIGYLSYERIYLLLADTCLERLQEIATEHLQRHMASITE